MSADLPRPKRRMREVDIARVEAEVLEGDDAILTGPSLQRDDPPDEQEPDGPQN
jgi:hypothetical protein